MIFPLWSIPAIAAILSIVRFFEKRFPVEPEQLVHSKSEVITDWKLAALRVGIIQLTSPVTTAAGIMLVNATGGGWFHLRADGWWFLLSVMLVILVGEFWGYLVHRAQHKFAVLWAMHSLHHSAESLSMITGARHFWLEDAIHTAVFPVLAIIFKIPPEVVPTIAAIYLLPEGLVHMNFRLSLGRFALCLNNPQYHRIHHSVEPQHLNKNFCRMLPVFDVIFGTAWKPGKDEFPATGLGPREKATGILDGIIWPIRHLPVQRLSRSLLQVGRNTVRLLPGIY
jgi:sterol desaturase/sphingolipid hydroxylase (fatty acid hydroxylase superfamily)